MLVGKGITFDSGGLNLKVAGGIEEMKFDMLGAGTVLGVFHAAASLKMPINLVTIVAAVENMADGDAYRPSDVLTSMSGKTIEVLNTDAEGRLILCDALTYAQRFEPQSLIDVATLTGACVVALGKVAHGLMSKHDDLSNELLRAGECVYDRAWRPAAVGTNTRACSTRRSRTSRTSAASTPARSPQAPSSPASPKASVGRIWTSRAPRGTKARRAWRRVGRSDCCASGCWTRRGEGKGVRVNFALRAFPFPTTITAKLHSDPFSAPDPFSMPRADFYLIAKPRFREDPLLLVCELARRACDTGSPTLILARDQEQAEAIDDALWAFDPDAYIPHQIAGSDEDDDETPVLISAPGNRCARTHAESSTCAMRLSFCLASVFWRSCPRTNPRANHSASAGGSM